jgi:hypothetical protein
LNIVKLLQTDFKEESWSLFKATSIKGVKLAIAQMPQYNMKDNGINIERGHTIA